MSKIEYIKGTFSFMHNNINYVISRCYNNTLIGISNDRVILADAKTKNVISIISNNKQASMSILHYGLN